MSSIVEQGKQVTFDEDVVLIDRVIDGDEGAFQTLYERYYDKVFAIARGILIDSEEAADVVQEIFTLVFRHLKRFNRQSKFSTWIYRVAVNRSTQQSRRAKFKRLFVPLTEAADRADPQCEHHFSDPKVDYGLAKLGETDRAILTLFYWDELSLQEIADTLECSANAAKTRLFRARERFRVYFEEASE